MRLRQQLERSAKSKPARPRSKAPSISIMTHKAFVPILTVWGAALLCLSVLVLPGHLVARMAVLAGLSSMGGVVKFGLAAVAALLGGGLSFVVAKALRDGKKTGAEDVSVVSAVTSRRIRPIDPAADLGSESLDAPIEEMPFGLDDEMLIEDEVPARPKERHSDAPKKPQPTLGELAKRGYEIEEPEDLAEDVVKPSFTRRHFKSALIESCEGATCEASPGSAEGRADLLAQKPSRSGGRSEDSESETRAAHNDDRPRALDLAEFAEIEGRNAVWVEEAPAAQPQAKPQATPRAASPMADRTRAALPETALEKLRQRPPEDLSLVEMVERFAAALHDHQQHQHATALPGGAGRDAALAEALKALTLFTERGFDQRSAPSDASELSETERELRSALMKLQTLRGAA